MSVINSGRSGGAGRFFRARGGSRRGRAAALVALAVAAAGLTGCNSAAAATVTRLGADDPGADPYTLVANTDRQQVTPRRRAGGQATGDTPGLYGGTRNAATCDPAKLLAFLQANPGKAKAWAAVRKIAVSALPGYVRKLTPVILRTDTLITNHGYRNGKPTSFPAVLQAGIAVLVDEYGNPVVKCNCGNPLSPPDQEINPDEARYTGASWKNFTKGRVTVIKPRNTDQGPLTHLTLVDEDMTMSFNRPLGTMGEADGPPAPLPPEETATPTDGPSDAQTPTETPSDGLIPTPGITEETTPDPGYTDPGTGDPYPGEGNPGPEDPVDPPVDPPVDEQTEPSVPQPS